LSAAASPPLPGRGQSPARATPPTLRRLVALAFPYWRLFVLAALGMAVYAATETGFAAIVRSLVETVVPGALSPEQLRIRHWLPWFILGLFLVRGAGEFGSTYCLGWVGRQVIKTLRQRVFDKFLGLPARFFDQASAAELLSRLTYNIEQIAESTSIMVSIVIREALTVLGLLGYMIWLSPVLAGVVFVVVPVVVLLTRMLGRIFRRYSERIQKSMGDLTRVAQEVLQSQRVVKIFNARAYEGRRFETANELNRRMNMRLVATRAGGDAATALLAAVGLSAVTLFATSDSVRQSMDLGDFGGFVTALVLMMRPLRALTGVNAVIQRGVAAGESIFQVLDSPEERDDGQLRIIRARGKVEFRDVSFTYSAEKGRVLRNVSVTVEPGQTLAIVGRSGGGKTTLVNLIPRFYDADEGVILLDDQPLEAYRLTDLRAQVSYVGQDVILFNDTIANNIAYGGLQGASREAVEAAVRAAHLGDVVARLPAGLDTMVGDRGLLLSGGQRQRVAIARALLKDAPILVLDEATSALDSESERHIQQALNELMANRTTFVIAHRLSTVEQADRILVMVDGRIAESGTHAQLLEAGGHYANLHRMQFRDE
jgi:subfamily B ATP-binding cassette protein MsbA